MSVRAFPVSDEANPGSWTVTGAASPYQALDADPYDSGIYCEKVVSGSNQTFKVGLASLSDPGVDTGHEVHVWTTQIGGATDNRFAVRLIQGASTLIDQQVFDLVRNNILEFTFSVPSGSAANITDYTTLRLEFEGIIVLGSFTCRVYEAYLQVPGAAGFEHLDIDPPGLKVAAAGSGHYLKLVSGGWVRVTGTETTGALYLDNGQIKVHA